MTEATSSSPKVGHVIRRFVPAQWGGTESAVFHLSHALQGKGIESPIFSTDMLSRRGSEVFGGVQVHRYAYTFPWLGLSPGAREQMVLKGGNPLSLPMFRGLLAEPGLSLIHTHATHRLGGIARTVARLRGIPYVVTVHGGHFTLPAELTEQMREPFVDHWEWGRAFGWLLGARRTLEDADAIICVGGDEYTQMQRNFPHKRVEFIPNGVHITPFATADGKLFRDHYGFCASTRLALCVSRIDPQKNQELLLECFAKFAERHTDYHLVMIGPVTVESYYQQLLKRINNSSLKGRVHVIPGLGQGDPLLPSAFAAADFFVLPSSHEPFGIVALEAWAAGIPCIASEVGGIPNFAQDGKNALLFPDRDGAALLRAMHRLAEDEALRQRLIAQAASDVNGYDWQSVTMKMISLYQSVMKKEAPCA